MAKKKASATKPAAKTDEHGRRILTPEHLATRYTVGPPAKPVPEPKPPEPAAEE
jgi:hypothetical protein